MSENGFENQIALDSKLRDTRKQSPQNKQGKSRKSRNMRKKKGQNQEKRTDREKNAPRSPKNSGMYSNNNGRGKRRTGTKDKSRQNKSMPDQDFKKIAENKSYEKNYSSSSPETSAPTTGQFAANHYDMSSMDPSNQNAAYGVNAVNNPLLYPLGQFNMSQILPQMNGGLQMPPNGMGQMQSNSPNFLPTPVFPQPGFSPQNSWPGNMNFVSIGNNPPTTAEMMAGAFNTQARLPQTNQMNSMMTQPDMSRASPSMINSAQLPVMSSLNTSLGLGLPNPPIAVPDSMTSIPMQDTTQHLTEMVNELRLKVSKLENQVEQLQADKLNLIAENARLAAQAQESQGHQV